jgi:hypothetical protein
MQIQIRKQIACGFMLLRTQNSADDWYFEIIVHCKKMNRYRYLGHIFFGWGGERGPGMIREKVNLRAAAETGVANQAWTVL